MEYQIFNQMDEGEFIRREGETEQSYMERMIKTVLQSRLESSDKDKIFNDCLAPEFGGCSSDEKFLCLKYKPQSWQRNPSGILHGGIISSAIDITLGMLAKYYQRDSMPVTVQLNVSFLREIPIEHPYYVLARADKAGRRVRFMSAEAFDEQTGSLAAKAAGIFM